MSEKGAEYTIEPTAGGLYGIVQHSGGINATVCNGLYTSHLKARDALISYIQSTDRLGYAEYPGKPEEKKRRVARKEDDGSSEG